jgi:glycosyltransferase involved in cell wall biosynthesis
MPWRWSVEFLWMLDVGIWMLSVMRVTHIITRLVIGGAQENTVATVLGLRKKPDLEVELISGPTTGPEGSMEPLLAPYPNLVTIVPPLVRPVHPRFDLRAARDLTSLLRARRPDIVHTHSGKAGILGRIAAHRAGVPTIIHHIHGPSFGPFQGALPNFIFRAAEKFAGRYTTHFFCSADAMTRLYLAAGIGRPEIYTRVFSGFQLEPFVQARNSPELRQKLGFAADAFVIGKIGRLSPLKGHDDLLLAAKALLPRCPQARFLLVGDGPLRSQIEARARELGIGEKIVYTGLLHPSEVPQYVGIMDCLAHLSYREAVSRALPQALAAGKPVVAYDFDGADEVCQSGKSGFIVATGDTQAAAEALLKLAADKPLCEAFGATGRAFVADQFPVQKMIDLQHSWYLRLDGLKRSK